MYNIKDTICSIGINLNNEKDIRFICDYANKNNIGLSNRFYGIFYSLKSYKGNYATWMCPNGCGGYQFYVYPKDNFTRAGYKLIDIQELDIYENNKSCKFMNKVG